jgi:hypothetical protein
MAARPFALPSTFDEMPGEPACDLPRPVAAAVEDNDDLVGKAQTAEALGQLPLFVMNNDKGG